jgi:hypothetical protein
MTVVNLIESGFSKALHASERSPEIPESEDLYGWLVGSWELDVLHYKGVNVASDGLKGEAHFGWVLGDRGCLAVEALRDARDDTPHLGRRPAGMADPVVQSGARAF